MSYTYKYLVRSVDAGFLIRLGKSVLSRIENQSGASIGFAKRDDKKIMRLLSVTGDAVQVADAFDLMNEELRVGLKKDLKFLSNV